MLIGRVPLIRTSVAQLSPSPHWEVLGLAPAVSYLSQQIRQKVCENARMFGDLRLRRGLTAISLPAARAPKGREKL
jgi:hypothetical protein